MKILVADDEGRVVEVVTSILDAAQLLRVVESATGGVAETR